MSQPSAEPIEIRGCNPSQKEAILHRGSPLLVLSTAGSGKTMVISHRVLSFMLRDRMTPETILVLTFTNKSAAEMNERTIALANDHFPNLPPRDDWWMGTFHSVCNRVINHDPEAYGLLPGFTIIDPDDALQRMQYWLDQNGGGMEPRALLDLIEEAKDSGKGIEWIRDRLARARDGGKDEQVRRFKLVEAAYIDFQRWMTKANLVDFADLILRVCHTWTQKPAIAEYYQNRFHAVLVDEYQDTNALQERFLRLIAAKHRNITCVGDDDQSLYSWRGARIANLFEFQDHWQPAKIINLEANYRCAPAIARAANALISHNKKRLPKKIVSAASVGEGEFRVIRANNQYHEADIIQEQLVGRTGSAAILPRTNPAAKEIERLMLERGIKAVLLQGIGSLSLAAAKDIMAFIRLARNPADDAAFLRVTDKLVRGVGDATRAELTTYADNRNTTILEAAMTMLAKGNFPQRQAEPLNYIVRTLDRICDQSTPYGMACAIADQMQMICAIKGERPLSFLANRQDEVDQIDGQLADRDTRLTEIQIGKLEDRRKKLMTDIRVINDTLRIIETAPDIDYLIAQAALGGKSLDELADDEVAIMTLHGAKGLEFDLVILPGWEQGNLPGDRTLDNPDDVEEERRVAYVGITRARRKAVITHAITRRKRARDPSQFIQEILNPPAAAQPQNH